MPASRAIDGEVVGPNVRSLPLVLAFSMDLLPRRKVQSLVNGGPNWKFKPFVTRWLLNHRNHNTEITQLFFGQTLTHLREIALARTHSLAQAAFCSTSALVNTYAQKAAALADNATAAINTIRARLASLHHQWPAFSRITPQGCFEGDHVLLSDDRKTGVGLPRCAFRGSFGGSGFSKIYLSRLWAVSAI
jgi:hypothetical protein